MKHFLAILLLLSSYSIADDEVASAINVICSDVEITLTDANESFGEFLYAIGDGFVIPTNSEKEMITGKFAFLTNSTNRSFSVFFIPDGSNLACMVAGGNNFIVVDQMGE